MELRTVLTGKTIPIHKDPLATPSNGTDIDDFGVCWLCWLSLAVAIGCRTSSPAEVVCMAILHVDWSRLTALADYARLTREFRHPIPMRSSTELGEAAVRVLPYRLVAQRIGAEGILVS